MSAPDSDRLGAYFEHLAAVCPPAMRVWTARNDADFCAAVEAALEFAIYRMESGAKLCRNLDELGLSWLLVQVLSAGSIPASAENYHNGHVDITIGHPASLPFLFLGECKIHKGYEHHCGGCEQLLVRYSSGRGRRAFCLDFFRAPEMYEKLLAIREMFDVKRPLKQLEDAVDHPIKGAFLTAHEHFTSARLEILHLGCNMHHPSVATADLESEPLD